MKKLWEPTSERANATLLADFMRRTGIGAEGSKLDYDELWCHSVENQAEFWAELWTYCDVIGEPGPVVIDYGKHIREARFFPNGVLNYAENLLRSRSDRQALIFYGEDGQRRSVTQSELAAIVGRLQKALIADGVKPGDRIAGIVANTPEAAAAMIATASIGAVWSSCSPDFGVRGVLDRFVQIRPKILFCSDGYFYNGKWRQTDVIAAEVCKQLVSVRRLVVLPYSGIGQCRSEAGVTGVSLENYLVPETGEPNFEQMGFNDPLFVMFSSGTTGLPKCMVHSIGGALLQHMKEHKLHCDLKPNDRLMFFTTCGWMMWNWLISALASNASVILYDGSPLFPNGKRLADIAEAENVTHFGASAKYYDSCLKAGISLVETHNLSDLRAVFSTGSPLSPASFNYIYSEWKEDLCLSSISGGTDILGCFAGGCPIAPVYSGQCQKRILGMDVRVFDESGNAVEEEAGELVCLSPHPSMPVEFLNDPDGSKYNAAYFEGYPGVWTHGDWAEVTKQGGVVFFGRSDATLNVSGVRIGTAEIYRPVEDIPEVTEALVVEHAGADSSELILFVCLSEGTKLSSELANSIRAQIRKHASPRHVPARIISVADIPRTKSGKIVELAVRDVIHGNEVKNVSALANPEALDLFRDIL